MFDLKIFKSALSDYSKTLKKVRDEIEQTERAIEDCMFAPLSKKDAKAAFRTWIGSEATEYRRLLSERLSFAPSAGAKLSKNEKAFGDNLRRSNLLSLGMPQSIVYQGHIDAGVLQRSLIGLFEEPICKAIDAALETLPWDPAAIDHSDRETTLTGLRKKLEALKEQEEKLVHEAEEVGIDPSRVQ